ncbi:Metacaspase-1 [Diplonema papillatum]|nr:Metacaspase-1 [Diplonema papillatum]
METEERRLREKENALIRREAELRERTTKSLQGAPLPLYIGEKVRTKRRVTFYSGKFVPEGEVGEITKIPGDRGGTICEVMMIKTGMVFDAMDRDVEPLRLRDSSFSPTKLSPVSTAAHSDRNARGDRRPPLTDGYVNGTRPLSRGASKQQHPPPEGTTRRKVRVRDRDESDGLLEETLPSGSSFIDNAFGSGGKPRGGRAPAVSIGPRSPEGAGCSYCNEPQTPFCKITGQAHGGSARRGEKFEVQRSSAAPPFHERPSILGAAKAVLVGVNYNGTSHQLRHSCEAARSMLGLLERSGFDSENCLLVDDQPKRQPTRTNIMNALKWLVEGAKPEECFFLHFVGHSLLPEDCEDEYIEFQGIAPVDYNDSGYIFADEMYEIFQKLPKGAKLTVVIDTEPCGMVIPLEFRVDAHGDTGIYEEAGPMSATVLVLCCVPDEDGPHLTPSPRRLLDASNAEMSTALVTAMGWRYRPTVQEVLADIKAMLRQRGLGYQPVLNCSEGMCGKDVFKLGNMSRMEQSRRIRRWERRLREEETELRRVDDRYSDELTSSTNAPVKDWYRQLRPLLEGPPSVVPPARPIGSRYSCL